MAAMLGARSVVATDGEAAVVSLAQANVKANAHLIPRGGVRVFKHKWGHQWPTSDAPGWGCVCLCVCVCVCECECIWVISTILLCI